MEETESELIHGPRCSGAGERGCVGKDFPPTPHFQQDPFTSGKKGFTCAEIREDVTNSVMETWPGWVPALAFPGERSEFPRAAAQLAPVWGAPHGKAAGKFPGTAAPCPGRDF